jgi:predicted transporter
MMDSQLKYPLDTTKTSSHLSWCPICRGPVEVRCILVAPDEMIRTITCVECKLAFFTDALFDPFLTDAAGHQ